MAEEQQEKPIVHLASNTIGNSETDSEGRFLKQITTLCGKTLPEAIVDLPLGEVNVCPECAAKAKQDIVHRIVLVLDPPPPKEQVN